MNYKMLDTLYDRSIEELEDMINDVLLDSERNDIEYKKLNNNNKILKNKYPKLNDIYEGLNPQELNKEEIDALIKMLDNELNMKYMIYEKIFILGNKEAYYYFKRMGIIKEEDKK